ncbi:hypothetical protein O181_003618 [Austropuccinia psidii MF-1]|uniref:Retrotransposon gag domain-containing protein n=1 Tax=Austropuccinia psidii MF-1 TaxID=1389203 RepID=A0A9Q3BF11_9BASI|nr:hypothetical protein [Austropuccinia psidii MF-1]
MQQMTQTMANLQEDSSSEASKPPAFETPSIKAPVCFDGTQPFKISFYSISYLNGRASKSIESYLSNLTNQDPSYLLNSWNSFKSQLFNFFGDPSEVKKSEAELDSLRMKKGGYVSLYIADFGSLVSRLGDCGERTLIHHFRKGFPPKILDPLTSHASIIDSLQELIDISLELDTRYHERQSEKSHYQEKKPEAPKSNSSHPQSS